MRLRLGLLQDPAAIEKQIAREAAEAQARKHKLEAPTVRTEAEMKAFDAETAEEKKKAKEKTKPRIRPLSEAKAIDTGANFVSESFLFLVGVGLIGVEWWRRESKEKSRREDVADRIDELEEAERISRRALVDLEKEILKLRALTGEKPTKTRILPKELWNVEQTEEKQEEQKRSRWLAWIPRFGFGGDAKSVPLQSPGPRSESSSANEDVKRNPVSSHTSSPEAEKVSKSANSTPVAKGALTALQKPVEEG